MAASKCSSHDSCRDQEADAIGTRAIPHPAWEELIADLPYLTFVLLDKDGHNRKTEAPERFDRELIQWLSDLEEAEALKSDPRDS